MPTSLFHKVPIKAVIIIDGVDHVKFTPRCVMSEDGKVKSIPDSMTVEVAGRPNTDRPTRRRTNARA